MTDKRDPLYVVPPHVPEGMAAVVYSPHVIFQAYKAALDVLERHQHRPIAMLAVAAMVVKLHCEASGSSHDIAFGIVHKFIERLRVLQDLVDTAVPTPDDSEAT